MTTTTIIAITPPPPRMNAATPPITAATTAPVQELLSLTPECICVHREETVSEERLSGNHTDSTQISFLDKFAESGNETRCILPSVVGVFGASVDRE